MTILKKLTAAAAASTLALGLGMSASAAVELFETSDSGNDGILNAVDQFQIINSRIDPLGALNPDTNTVSFQVGDAITGIFLDFGVIQANPDIGDALARGVRNLVLNVSGTVSGDDFATFQITDDNGQILLEDLEFFNVAANETLEFAFSGTAFGGTGTRPSYDVGVFGDQAMNAVPVPGAAVLFLTAAAGGALRLRKKAA